MDTWMLIYWIVIGVSTIVCLIIAIYLSWTSEDPQQVLPEGEYA